MHEVKKEIAAEPMTAAAKKPSPLSVVLKKKRTDYEDKRIAHTPNDLHLRGQIENIRSLQVTDNDVFAIDKNNKSFENHSTTSATHSHNQGADTPSRGKSLSQSV